MRAFSKNVLSILLCLLFVAGCVIPAIAAGKNFDDVKTGQWYYKYVDYMSEKGVIAGHGGTNLFKPNSNVKRNEFIKMINCVFGLTEEADVSFVDVPDSWYAPYYRAAYKQGYLQKALGDTVYQLPTKDLLREEAVALIMAYLNPDIDVSGQTLEFSDAAGINPKYKKFIAQSVYQGIVLGYTDGTFKPQNTLTRAEAATILCKAAGTILTSGNSVSAPETDVSGNAVINGAGASLNFNVDGDLIITEEVEGTVEIKNSVIHGTVYVRSKNAGVEFKNCQAEEIIVDGNATVMLSGGTDVKKFKLNNTSVTFMDDASVETFTVTAAAKNSTILSRNAKDSVKNYAIYASGFNSDVLHTGNIVFGEDIKATIKGKVYSASGFVEDTLRTYWADGYEYVKYSVANDGYVDYFYSKTTVGTSNFADQFKAAASTLKFTKTVTADLAVNEKTLGASLDYKYLVIGFRGDDGKYKDIKQINREVEYYGFSGDVTTVSVSGGFKVSFSVGFSDNAHKGSKVYYTFTDNKDFGLADIKDISKLSTLTTQTVFKEADADGKKYIAVFVYENNIVHVPKVAQIPITYNGFLAVPTVTIKGGDKKDVLSYSLPTGTSSQIKYFYVETVKENYIKNETTFNDEYNAISDSLKGQMSLSGKGNADLKTANVANKRMYVVICAKGNKPFYITRTYDGTGYVDNVVPTAYKIGVERAVSFTPAVNGSLKYVFVDSNITNLTAKSFGDLYNAADAVKGEIKNCTKDTLKFANITSTRGVTEYLAVMLSDGSADYLPVCVKFTDPGSGVKSASFSADIIGGSQKFTETNSFKDVASEYYYEAFYANPKNFALQFDVDAIANTAYDNGLANKAFDDVKARELTSVFIINSDGTFDTNGKGCIPEKDEKQIVLRLVVKTNDTDTYVFRPFILDISKFDFGFDGEDAIDISIKDGKEIVSIDLELPGTIKCYYTNTRPSNAAAFDKGYAAASYKDSKKVTKATTNLQLGDGYYIYALSEFKYVTFLFEDEDGKRVPQTVERPEKHRTGINKATITPQDHNSFRIEFEVLDIFEVANVTPVMFYTTSKDKMAESEFSNVTPTSSLGGAKKTEGYFGLTYSVANGKNYVYIVIGAKRSDGTYKFIPYELKIPRTVEA